MRLIITRPEEDAVTLKAKLESRGHTAIPAPLLKIVARPGAYVPPLAYQLICATSANALTYFQAEDRLKNIPLLTVGPQSSPTIHGIEQRSGRGPVHRLRRVLLCQIQFAKLE